MNFANFLRATWFKCAAEREWLSTQSKAYYAMHRKSVVLYALRRLSLIFNMPFSSLEGATELVVLYQRYQDSQSEFDRRLSRLIPRPCSRNPLQVIMDDVTMTNDYFTNVPQEAKPSQASFLPLCEHFTVADYVRLICEYDKETRRVDHLRAVTWLGVIPP